MKTIGTKPREPVKVPQHSEVQRPLAATTPRPVVQAQPQPSSDFRAGAIAQTQRPPATSKIHFVVHPGMEEIKRFADEQGWLKNGFSNLSIVWQDLVFTTDHWKTTQTLRSTEVPSPISNGCFSLPNVPKGANVEFAIHVGVACHAPSDIAGYRERGDTWLNNNGQNYTQTSQ
jgi:hypothetical protein